MRNSESAYLFANNHFWKLVSISIISAVYSSISLIRTNKHTHTHTHTHTHPNRCPFIQGFCLFILKCPFIQVFCPNILKKCPYSRGFWDTLGDNRPSVWTHTNTQQSSFNNIDFYRSFLTRVILTYRFILTICGVY